MVYYILSNPNAGSRRGKLATEELLQFLAKKHIDYQLYMTVAAGDEARLIQKILAKMKTNDQDRKNDRLLILGGDGTLSLALDALPAEMPFAYIPTGSGNDFARSLNIPRGNLLAAFDKVNQAEAKDFYVIRYDSASLHGFAVNNIGIGLDAAIVKATNESQVKKVLNKVKLGQLSYLINTLYVLFHKKSFQIRLEGQNTFKDAFLFTLTKHPYFGGGIPIAPQASSEDDCLTLVEVDKIPYRQFFGLLRKIVAGKHLDDKRIHLLTGNSFEISVRADEVMQIDGETHQLTANDILKLSTEKRHIFLN